MTDVPAPGGPALVRACWSRPTGWTDPVPAPSDRLTLGAHTSFIHYGQAVFEGLRAFRREDGGVWLFRARDHHRRLRDSAARMSMPPVPWDVFEHALRQFVGLHVGTLAQPGDSLYLRPVQVASTESLGINRPVEDCQLLVTGLTNFRHVGGDRPLRLRVERDLRRAWPGGVGAVKCAGNYGLARLGQQRALEAGCDDALWLSPSGCVSELSSMNLFAVLRSPGRDRLVTPRTDGLLLPGVTRHTILALAAEVGLRPAEEHLDVGDLLTAVDDGTVTELFATGTASGVVPVGELHDAGRVHQTNAYGTAHAAALGTLIAHVQAGRRPDPYGWLQAVPMDVPVGVAGGQVGR